MFCAPPQLLPADGPIFDLDEPGFETLTSGALGDVEAFFSGIDAILEVPLGALDADVVALDTLDVLLAAATFARGAFDAVVIAPLIAEYATLSVAGDALAAAMGVAIAMPPPFPSIPQAPLQPVLTVDILCGPCSGGGDVGGGEGGPIIPPVTNPCPGYGYISGPCIPPDGPPTIPPSSPVPPTDQGCLNPNGTGGYVAGPCPVQPPPPDQGPQPPPEPTEPPEPPEPPPEVPPTTPPDQPPTEPPVDPEQPPDNPPPFLDTGGDLGGSTGNEHGGGIDDRTIDYV